MVHGTSYLLRLAPHKLPTKRHYCTGFILCFQENPISLRVFSHLMYFSKHEDEEVQLKAVTGLGKWLMNGLKGRQTLAACCGSLSCKITQNPSVYKFSQGSQRLQNYMLQKFYAQRL